MSSVDVVVPCYRYGHYLSECVESVLGQTGVSVRVLIIDDASPDNTPEVASALVSRDPRVSYVRHPVNKGHIATYNEGLLEWAGAKYSLLLSADDYLLPGALSRAVNLMDAHREVGFTFGNYIELHAHGVQVSVMRFADAVRSLDKLILIGREFIEASKADNLVATSTAVVRTELQKKLGGYQRQLPHTGDMEMWLRFSAHTSVGFINDFQGVYRRSQKSMSYDYYKGDGRVLELRQRQAALNCFFDRCSDVLPDVEVLRVKLFRSLAMIAVKHASMAFNDGELRVSKRLAEFAVSVDPKIYKSSAWLRLATKYQIDTRAWKALQFPLAVIRSFSAKAARAVRPPHQF